MRVHKIKTFKEPPVGVKVFTAFSKQQSYCEHKRDQEHTIPADGWVDLGVEWTAIDPETVTATWPFLKMTISLDGEEIPHPKRYSRGPFKSVLECPDRTYVAYGMSNALFIPPLPVGDHKVIWTIVFEHDLNDGWDNYQKNQIIVVTSMLHVVGKIDGGG
jgi:hypothetical protein